MYQKKLPFNKNTKYNEGENKNFFWNHQNSFEIVIMIKCRIISIKILFSFIIYVYNKNERK